MTMITIQLKRASVEDYVPSDRCAVSPTVFDRLLREHLGAEWAGIEEVSINDTCDSADELDALDDDLRDRSRQLAEFVGESAWVLLPGAGDSGCDVWALATVEAD